VCCDAGKGKNRTAVQSTDVDVSTIGEQSLSNSGHSNLLGCYTVLSGKCLSTSGSVLVPSSSGSSSS
jgi:hypothetical protein